MKDQDLSPNTYYFHPTIMYKTPVPNVEEAQRKFDLHWVIGMDFAYYIDNRSVINYT